MRIAIDPKVDYAFKHVFGREPTIAICFVDTLLFPAIDDYHLVFELRDRRHQMLFTDQIALHILELTKFNKSVEQLETSLDRWLYFLRHAPTLDVEALPRPLNVPEIRWALGDLKTMSQDERERERYEYYLKKQRDIYTALAEKREEGREEGEVRVQIRRIRALERLLRQQVRSSDELKTLSIADLETFAVELEEQLDARLSTG